MSEEVRIEETLARIGEAWNAGDAAAYAAEFTEDATYVTFSGDVMHNRTAIGDVHRWLFEGPLRGSRMVGLGQPGEVAGTDHKIRFLRPGVAHVLSGGGVELAGSAGLPADRESVVTFVLVEDGGEWRVAAFQNTRRSTEARS
ncbi:SgcJ/EcaC family oxidoreductase [Pseudonocardia sp. TRM90224]|uniref:SgcJ/EcaC family oxidoreductase n=1 Tax=Pseudonocardia sp. TRM90224 TaxID=2812678 RepID=UPI001E5EDE5A|nr:SgcJ/EcaC family oxidoreductase [Pseudonocardia sp. TRM90224]